MTTRMHIITLMIMMIIMTRAMSIMTIILNPVNIPMTTLVILDGIIQSFKLTFFALQLWHPLNHDLTVPFTGVTVPHFYIFMQ